MVHELRGIPKIMDYAAGRIKPIYGSSELFTHFSHDSDYAIPTGFGASWKTHFAIDLVAGYSAAEELDPHIPAIGSR